MNAVILSFEDIISAKYPLNSEALVIFCFNAMMTVAKDLAVLNCNIVGPRCPNALSAITDLAILDNDLSWIGGINDPITTSRRINYIYAIEGPITAVAHLDEPTWTETAAHAEGDASAINQYNVCPEVLQSYTVARRAIDAVNAHSLRVCSSLNLYRVRSTDSIHPFLYGYEWPRGITRRTRLRSAGAGLAATIIDVVGRGGKGRSSQIEQREAEKAFNQFITALRWLGTTAPPATSFIETAMATASSVFDPVLHPIPTSSLAMVS